MSADPAVVAIMATALGDPHIYVSREYDQRENQRELPELLTHWQARAAIEALTRAGYIICGPYDPEMLASA